MALQWQQERVKNLLTETITLLCKNSLQFYAEFTIEALIGITLDKSEVFLVNINETVTLPISDGGAAESGQVDDNSDTELVDAIDESLKQNGLSPTIVSAAKSSSALPLALPFFKQRRSRLKTKSNFMSNSSETLSTPSTLCLTNRNSCDTVCAPKLKAIDIDNEDIGMLKVKDEPLDDTYPDIIFNDDEKWPPVNGLKLDFSTQHAENSYPLQNHNMDCQETSIQQQKFEIVRPARVRRTMKAGRRNVLGVEIYKRVKAEVNLDRNGISYKVKGGSPAMKHQDCSRCKLKCSTKISEAQRLEIFANYWQMGEKQSEFVNSYVKEVPVQYLTLGHQSRRMRTLQYFLPSGADAGTVKVCRDMFLNTLCVKINTVYTQLASNKRYSC